VPELPVPEVPKELSQGQLQKTGTRKSLLLSSASKQ
jgi:hypothetical protein